MQAEERNDNSANTSQPDATGTTLPVKAKRRFAGTINAYPPYRSKLEDMLRDEHREEYEALLVRKATLKVLRQWLLDRGYDIGREAVKSHRGKFCRDFGEVRRGAAVAERFARIARTAGLTLPEATIGGMHQMLMQFFTNQQKNNTLAAGDVRALAASVEDFVDTFQKVERIRRELSEVSVGGGANAPEDYAVVVDRVRTILGIEAK